MPDFEDDRAIERTIIARRAHALLRPEGVASFGFGIPDGVAGLARAAGGFDRYFTTLDHGHHGGEALQGPIFGFVRDGEARIDSPAQFDFYSGGGIDTAVLGFGEFDARGDVNVSKLGGRIIGPGGFIDIAHGAKQVIFCGTMEGKGLSIAIDHGRMAIASAGAFPKVVERVAQVTFSGQHAIARRQDVRYVTERAVFHLAAEGIVLEEVAPGLDVRRDVIDRMGFVPILPAGGPATMDSRFLLP